MRLPKYVTIAGIDIEIVQDDELFENNKCLGRACYQSQQIRIASGVVPEDTVMQVFYHELLHWIFYIHGDTKRQNDEDLIDRLAASLWQAEKSRRPIDYVNSVPIEFVDK
jgi:hypothetical protein